MGALALLVTAILATLVLYFWARKAQLEKQLLEEREENERMMSVAEDLERRLSHLKQQKKNTPALGVDVLDRLCQQYYVYEGTDNLQPRIVKEVRAVVEGLRTDAAMQRSLEQALNEQNNQVMEKLRAFFPRWKEEDFLLYLFTASGFSSTQGAHQGVRFPGPGPVFGLFGALTARWKTAEFWWYFAFS